MRVSNSFDPDQVRHVVGPDLVQTVCKDYQQTALVDKEHNEISLFTIPDQIFEIQLSLQYWMKVR